VVDEVVKASGHLQLKEWLLENVEHGLGYGLAQQRGHGVADLFGDLSS